MPVRHSWWENISVDESGAQRESSRLETVHLRISNIWPSEPQDECGCDTRSMGQLHSARAFLPLFFPPSQTPTPFMIAQLQVVLLQAPFSSSLSHVMALTRFCFQLMAAHLSILAWRIPWTGEPGRLQSMGSQRVKHDWRTNTSWLFYLYLLYETLSQESHMEASDFLFSLPGNGTSFLHPCSCLSIFI